MITSWNTDRYRAITRSRDSSKMSTTDSMMTPDSLTGSDDGNKVKAMTNKRALKARHALYHLVTSRADAMRKEEFLTDVTLVCGNSRFPAHKIVLAAGSPFFQNLFGTASTQKTQDFEIKDVDAEALGFMLDFLYTGHLAESKSNNSEFLEVLLATAHRLEVPIVKDFCFEVLMDDIATDKFLHLWDIAEKYGSDETLQAILEYLAENFPEVRQTNEFLKLNRDRLVALLTNSKLSKEAHNEVLEGVLAWVKYDPSTRRSQAPDILQSARFSKLSSYNAVRVVDEEPLLKGPWEMSKRFILGLSAKLAGVDFPTTNTKENRIAKEDLVYAVDTKIADKASPTSILDAELDQLGTTSSSSPEGPKTDHVLMFLGNERDYFDFLSQRQSYSFVQNEWGSVERPPATLANHHTVCSYNGIIYVLGYSKMTLLRFPVVSNDVHAYDVAKNKWSTPTKLLTERYAFGAAALDGSIYIVGGRAVDQRPILEVDCYDAPNNNWRTVAPLPRGRIDPAIAAGAGKLYVVGNTLFGHGSSIELYDPTTNQWTELATPPTVPMTVDPVATVVAGKLYIVNNYGPPSLHVLDLNDGTWKTFAIPMRSMRNCVALDSMNVGHNPTVSLVYRSGEVLFFEPPDTWFQLKTRASICPRKAVLVEIPLDIENMQVPEKLDNRPEGQNILSPIK